MTEQTWWVVAIVAVVVAAVIGFFVGRQAGSGKRRIEELESQVSRQNEEITSYKREVGTHFEKTATLFVAMAGSYKDLFQHLSSGYEKLSAGSARDLFKDRVTALLLEETKNDAMNGKPALERTAAVSKASDTAPPSVKVAASPIAGAAATAKQAESAATAGAQESETAGASADAKQRPGQARGEPDRGDTRIGEPALASASAAAGATGTPVAAPTREASGDDQHTQAAASEESAQAVTGDEAGKGVAAVAEPGKAEPGKAEAAEAEAGKVEAGKAEARKPAEIAALKSQAGDVKAAEAATTAQAGTTVGIEPKKTLAEAMAAGKQPPAQPGEAKAAVGEQQKDASAGATPSTGQTKPGAAAGTDAGMRHRA